MAGNVIRAEWERYQHTKSSSCSVLKHQKRTEYYYKITVHVRTHPERAGEQASERERAYAERRDTSIVNKYNVIYRSYLVTQTYFTMCTEPYTQLTFFFLSLFALSLLLYGWFVCCRFSCNSFPCSDQRFFFHLSFAHSFVLFPVFVQHKIRLTCIFTLYDWLAVCRKFWDLVPLIFRRLQKCMPITRLQREHENFVFVCSVHANGML